MLEDAEPHQLAILIIENLELIEKDGIKYLTCEHRVFFNSLWSDALVSNVSKSKQMAPQHPLQKRYDVKVSNDDF
jgi:hypothetical protein